jgi:tetratricopeptide (TPR) repeat protein
MSYGISGNINDAIKTFEYGVSVDPTYPMFYYNLACCYGEQNDIDKTVHYLELAIKYKKNTLKGEELANPYEDNSFKRFIDNDKFINIVGKTFPKISIDILKITDSETPKDYSSTNTINCKSLQAYTFYKSPDLFVKIIGKIKNKDIQNFESEKDNGSILYFEFEDKFIGQAFLESFIWGEKQPTKMHPETFFSKGKYLIIWSFNEGSQIKTISENKIKALYK